MVEAINYNTSGWPAPLDGSDYADLAFVSKPSWLTTETDQTGYFCLYSVPQGASRVFVFSKPGGG